MTGRANTFGAVASDSEAESAAMTDLAGTVTDLDGSRKTGSARAAATRLREHGERVRRRELDTALSRLEASGASDDLTPEERRILARLSVSIADALVERWVAELGADGVDEDAALALFSE